MTNTISMPVETLMRWEGELDHIAGAHHISDEIVALFNSQATAVEGEMEVMGWNHALPDGPSEPLCSRSKAQAVIEQYKQDAAIGAVVWKFIDRMGDHCEVDKAETILDQFVAAVTPHILAAIDGEWRSAAMKGEGDE